MNRNTIENILNFLKEKEDKELPKKWFDSIKKIELVKELENHPDGIQYKHKGDLNLKNSNITKLPNDLYVGGGLYLNYCQYLTELPNNLYVEFSLDLQDCKELKKLPDDLYVGGFLDLTNTNILELPNNLYVDGFLRIGDTPLAKKYTDEQIRDIVASTGGRIRGNIYRQ